MRTTTRKVPRATARRFGIRRAPRRAASPFSTSLTTSSAVAPPSCPMDVAFVVGGTSDYSFTGDNRASFFDPATGRFVQSQSMVDGRWYATATTLGDGRIMAFSGLKLSGGTNNTVEIYGIGTPEPVGAARVPPRPSFRPCTLVWRCFRTARSSTRGTEVVGRTPTAGCSIRRRRPGHPRFRRLGTGPTARP